MLARRFDCAVHPARCIRLPGNRYRLEIHDALELARTASAPLLTLPPVLVTLAYAVARSIRRPLVG